MRGGGRGAPEVSGSTIEPFVLKIFFKKMLFRSRFQTAAITLPLLSENAGHTFLMTPSRVSNVHPSTGHPLYTREMEKGGGGGGGGVRRWVLLLSP